ncbi:uncharacterized protein B0416.5-like [Hydractinia symbiolongicarpus]|uniref:uncharacterized protein B0416.5-like n=1 Tax=Hydractinia symbiolongicarpus TaxID=13093 RepID=UPI00254B2674|nr:uncharacterized protein B0416.5-like [Hydractinia symbiolongicarpus]
MNTKDELSEKHINDKKIIQPCKYRWVILALYGFALASNYNASISYFTISDMICEHYNITDSVFLLPSTISTITCIISYVLGMFLTSRYGLRTTVVIGSGANAIGAALIIPASQSNGFIWFSMCEVFWGFSSGVMYQIVTDISEVWFPAHQHALATNINMIMANIGCGISYLQTMFLFSNTKSMLKADFQNSLNILIYSQCVPCILAFVLNLFFYRESPKYSPSLSQAQRTGPGQISLQETVGSIKTLVKDFRFGVFALILGFNSAFDNIYTVIADILIAPSYSNSEKLVSMTGLLAVVVGCIGCMLFSLLLDKTKKYKSLIMLLLFVSLVLFTLFLEFLIHIYPVYVVYLVSTLAWFFFTPSAGVLADIISEITYPVNNSTSFALCCVLGDLLTIAYKQLFGWLGDKRKTDVMAYLLCGTLGIQVLLLIGVPVVKKRSLCDGNSVVSSLVEA